MILDETNPERFRIAHMVRENGLSYAVQWANRVICIYHSAVSNRFHHASSRSYRRSFLESIDGLEQFVSDNE